MKCRQQNDFLAQELPLQDACFKVSKELNSEEFINARYKVTNSGK